MFSYGRGFPGQLIAQAYSGVHSTAKPTIKRIPRLIREESHDPAERIKGAEL